MTIVRHLFLAACAGANLWIGGCTAETAPRACKLVAFKGADFTMCSFDVKRDDIRLFLTHPGGAPYVQFNRLAGQLRTDGTIASLCGEWRGAS